MFYELFAQFPCFLSALYADRWTFLFSLNGRYEQKRSPADVFLSTGLGFSLYHIFKWLIIYLPYISTSRTRPHEYIFYSIFLISFFSMVIYLSTHHPAWITVYPGFSYIFFSNSLLPIYPSTCPCRLPQMLLYIIGRNSVSFWENKRQSWRYEPHSGALWDLT